MIRSGHRYCHNNPGSCESYSKKQNLLDANETKIISWPISSSSFAMVENAIGSAHIIKCDVGSWNPLEYILRYKIYIPQ